MTSNDFEMTTGIDSRRSALASTALGAVALSAVGLVTTSIGVLMNAHGFQSRSDVQTPLSDTVFLLFVLGAVVAGVAGVACFIRSRGEQDRRAEARAAVVAAAYLVLAVVTVVVVSLVNPNG
jgi:uncharacterized membrane protein